MTMISPDGGGGAEQNIFDWAGLPLACAPGLRRGASYLRLVWNDTASTPASEADQLSFPFPFKPRPISFVSRRRETYLDFGVYDTFRDIPGAAKAALRLEARGVHVLGQLVQLSEGRLRAYRFLTDDHVAMFKARLSTIDLGFNMRLPHWNARREKLLVSAA